MIILKSIRLDKVTLAV